VKVCARDIPGNTVRQIEWLDKGRYQALRREKEAGLGGEILDSRGGKALGQHP